jgi:hypothetical protein
MFVMSAHDAVVVCSAAGDAVDQLTEDVGVAGMPGGLAGGVRDHPAQAEVFAVDRRHDRRFGITEAADQLVALLDRGAVVGDDLGRAAGVSKSGGKLDAVSSMRPR